MEVGQGPNRGRSAIRKKLVYTYILCTKYRNFNVYVSFLSKYFQRMNQNTDKQCAYVCMYVYESVCIHLDIDQINQ
jgi:hypothetical protein